MHPLSAAAEPFQKPVLVHHAGAADVDVIAVLNEHRRERAEEEKDQAAEGENVDVVGALREVDEHQCSRAEHRRAREEPRHGRPVEFEDGVVVHRRRISIEFALFYALDQLFPQYVA